MNMSEILLKITDLHASVGDKEILKGVNLEIGRGEIHAVMGPNGAGKSTLSAVLTGKPDYNVTSGTIEFLGRDLLAMKPEERAWAGIFLSFQYPVEIPGVTITNFMKTAVNSSRKARGLEPLKAPQFMKLLKEKMELDVEVTKLKLLRSNFFSNRYRLEDEIGKILPAKIARLTSLAEAYETDIRQLKHSR